MCSIFAASIEEHLSPGSLYSISPMESIIPATKAKLQPLIMLKLICFLLKLPTRKATFYSCKGFLLSAANLFTAIISDCISNAS